MQDGDYTENAALKNLPRGVALSWGLVKEPQRGPKREMDIDKIVSAAIEIADRDGLQAVSMNRVAQSLGFTAMSLYRYVPSKEDLLLLMMDAVCDAPFPEVDENTDWRDSMRLYVRTCADVFREHPWFGDIPIPGVPVTPNNLKIIDWCLRGMRALPLTASEKMSVVLLVSSYARTSGMLMRDMDRAVQSGVSLEAFSGIGYTEALKLLVSAERYPDLRPIIASGAYTGEGQSAEEEIDDFAFGLERILDGIERYLAEKK